MSLLKWRNEQLGQGQRTNLCKSPEALCGRPCLPALESGCVLCYFTSQQKGIARNTGGASRPQPPVLPCPEMGDFRMRSRQAREQEGMLHSKPRLSNVFGVGRGGAVPGVFPLRKSQGNELSLTLPTLN